jgi:chlorobactene glucosyltransferase
LRLRIVVIDDHSRDRTFAIASALAQTYPRLTVLRSPPLPPHWVGKSHACWIGVRVVEEDADWLCFVDADVWAEPRWLRAPLQRPMPERSICYRLLPDRNCKALPNGW